MTESKPQTDRWEAMYKTRPSGTVNPEQCVADLVDEFRQHKVKRVLDLGCGDGRHLVFLASQGFEMYGADCSPTALELAEEWLDGEDLTASLECTDITELPWEDGFFDAVLCIQVLNHNTLDRVKKTFTEVRRVLGESGYFLGTAMKDPPPADWKDGDFIEEDYHTYIPLKGHEKGVPHHCFSMDELEGLLSDFAPVIIEDESGKSDESPDMHRFTFLAKK